MQQAIKLYTYKSFGLYIKSEIKLPELPQEEYDINLADLTISIKDLTQLWLDNKGSAGKFIVGNDQVLFQIANLATFCVQDGKEIIVSPIAGSDENQIRLFILGSCMGALLLQKKILPLHGSALTFNGKVYTIIGESGAGKSTLAHALLLRGFELLSDDLIAITFNAEGKPIVHPSYPQQKLWQESLQQFGKETDAYAPLFQRETKYQVPVNSSYCNQALPLAGIYELAKDENSKKLSIFQVSKLECLKILHRHTFRRTLIAKLGLSPWHFQESVAIANHTYMLSIQRPNIGFTAHQIADEIVSSINKEALLT